ncbi:hypothetical protein BDV06DRAFT_168615 [Aspergillus oleicola]
MLQEQGANGSSLLPCLTLHGTFLQYRKQVSKEEDAMGNGPDAGLKSCFSVVSAQPQPVQDWIQSRIPLDNEQLSFSLTARTGRQFPEQVVMGADGTHSDILGHRKHSCPREAPEPCKLTKISGDYRQVLCTDDRLSCCGQFLPYLNRLLSLRCISCSVGGQTVCWRSWDPVDSQA